MPVISAPTVSAEGLFQVSGQLIHNEFQDTLAIGLISVSTTNQKNGKSKRRGRDFTGDMRSVWYVCCCMNCLWDDVNKCLLTPDKAAITDQTNNSIHVYVGEVMYLLGLLIEFGHPCLLSGAVINTMNTFKLAMWYFILELTVHHESKSE